jgi:hypothetical protein
LPDVAPSSVSAIVATLDLQLVRLIRAAMQDDGRHAATALGPAPSPQPQLRQHFAPDPVYEPRRHIHPTPRYEPRPVIHPSPRIAPGGDCCVPCEPTPELPDGRCPIQPPWKVRPWDAPVPIKLEVKVVVVRPDIVSKGSLIDFFC